MAVVSLVFGSHASLSVAQERDPAAAQGLFDQARQLSRQGRFSDACPKLEESNRLDPGIGTQFHLADCYERSGRVASAWATFLDVASVARSSNQPDREKAAARRAASLESRLPRLVITVPESSQVPGLEIRRGGILMGAAQWGTPVPVDPGEIELLASAPGRRSLKQALRLEEGKTASLQLPALAIDDTSAPGQPLSAVPPKSSPSASKGDVPDAPPESSRDASSSARTGLGPWPVVLAGAAVVGFGVGATFALMAKSANDDSKRDCDANQPNSCGPEGIKLRNEALSKGNIATVGFVAGGALLAGAGVAWLLQSSASEPAATGPLRLRAQAAVGPGAASVYMQGSF